MTDFSTIIGAVGGVLGTLAAIITAWALLRKSNAEVKQADTGQDATAINGYNKLMDDLQQEIARLRDELADNRARLDILEQERIQWRRDRAEMECRIKKLEDQLARKERELAELKAEKGGC